MGAAAPAHLLTHRLCQPTFLSFKTDKVKQVFYKLSKKIQQVFDFNRPQFSQLDCIDLVLENKSLLLLSWSTVHTTRLSIRQSKAVYHQSNGAVICRLPGNTHAVDIVLSNIWRKNKITLPLKHLSVDRETLRLFDKDFTAILFPSISIENLQPALSTQSIGFTKLHPSIEIPRPVIPALNISINQLQLHHYVP